MPWMPEVFSAPLAGAGSVQEGERANDAVGYYEGLLAAEPAALVRSFAGDPSLDDPRAGRIEGAAAFADFALDEAAWLRGRDAVVENVALTRTESRTVEESVLHVLADDGRRVELPVAVVSDRNRDRTLKMVRVYHSTWPLTGTHAVRPPLLPEDPDAGVGGVVGDYMRLLAAGDLEGILALFDPDAYAREPSGAGFLHRGEEGLRGFYAAIFGSGGGIPLEHCAVTDDGVRCAVEYNCVRWGGTELPPQAGVAVYERGAYGGLAAARIYDDVEPPRESDTSAAGTPNA